MLAAIRSTAQQPRAPQNASPAPAATASSPSRPQNCQRNTKMRLASTLTRHPWNDTRHELEHAEITETFAAVPAWRWIPRILPRLGFGYLLRAPIRKLPRASYTALPRFPAWYSLRFLPRPAVPLVRSIRRFPADRNDASNVCRLSERENPLHRDILTSFAVLAPSIFDSRCNNVKALGICTHSTYERSLTASSTVMKDRKAFHTVKRQKQTRGTAHFLPLF